MSLFNPILSPADIKPYLTKGERFIKWDDETSIASPVILRVDSKGYYLYWTFQSKEIEFIELTSIRDTRFGKYAKIPKSQKLREVFNMDFPENNFLAKTLCVVAGPDMVDLTFHNFVSYKENVGKDWASDIMAIVRNPLQINASRYSFYEKIHVKLTLQLNAEGKIPVRNIFQMFPADRKRVEQALNSCHLSKGKNDAINPEDFPESVYRSFLMQLCPRPEIDEIFTSHHSKAKPYMTKDHLTKFINQKQRDSRLNELLFPPAKQEQVQTLIEKYEPSAINKQRGQLSPEGMVWFLCGSENSVVSLEKIRVHQDMNQPFTHYFINSSHNTYLTAGQFSGISSPEMYRQTLLSGCRCVELDCWKGKPPEEEPIITHGFTMTTEILFKDVIEAIAESAFKTSSYPIVLSFENHVDSAKQQAKMADYCRTIFGDMLLTELLEKFPIKPGCPVPSPNELMGKILIKNKKNQAFTSTEKKAQSGDSGSSDQTNAQSGENTENETVEEAGGENEGQAVVENVDEEEKQIQSDEGTAGQEVTAYEEMSSLVNYVQPVKFDSFEVSAQKNQSYVISSFVETKAYDLLTKFPVQFVEYNKRQMSRIYPKGTRMDSSNYMPQMFWNVGCQMVALNFQTMDLAMQQNMALFEFNGGSGYILKHEFMRQAEKQFDPFTVDRIDVVVANTLSITVLSGQFLSDKSVKTYVEVELFGLPGDPKRKYKTKLTSTANSINPVWKEEPYVFEKILMPEMASLRVAVFEEGGKFIGHRIIPINVIRSGFHHMCLRSESNMPLTMPSLFVYVEVKDYIPDTWADLTHALSNPIKAFKAHEKSSIKMNNKGSSIDEKSNSPQSNGIGGSGKPSVKVTQNGPQGSLGTGKADAVKEAAEPETTNQDELQKQKSFLKLQKKHKKELKELERKVQKHREEILQKYSSAFSDLNTQLNKKPNRKCQKKKSLEDDYCSIWGAGEIPGKPDPKIVELKEKMEQELTRASEEFFESIWKKREQHSAEQFSKLLELAQERQATELKVLKESTDSDTKLMKKKLEMKRLERLDAMSKNTMDKAAQERLKKEINNSHIQEVVQVLQMISDKWSNHQQKLEEKQNEGLQKIREKGEQTQKDLQGEYQEKLKSMHGEVAEQIHNCMAPWFPAEAKSLKKESVNCANTWEFLFARHEKGGTSAENSQQEAKTEEEPAKEVAGEILPNDLASAPMSKDPTTVEKSESDIHSGDIPAPESSSKAEEEAKDMVGKVPSEKESTQ
ncbi:PREDICTED: 1-phosphatidylinositol 4,5-bisphosphate phosphodiesterase beta-2 [Nanorana parkeri]|uniref:1-phosphatidylinositol 4,5-bisphosphate phosphodiesterase beta-2 n=1 Tax=Nanorana parkeri TaxID=125878 RepID=UPI000854F7BA|nr:PREDICTED: 1-phosphatidylinositol 4,5-bisphosphate phosphodiesterase beta-2 [Nanorana parkeri]